VVPASTLANWQNELLRFCPSFRVVTYHGSQTERNKLRYELKTGISEGEVDVILSTYTIFERESGKSDRSFLYSQSFEYLILDEAHCIKNAESSRYMNLNGLRTKHRLLLSGTPVQNDLSELLAMLSFLMPHVFGRTNCELLIEAFGWTRSGNNSTGSGSLSMIQLRGMLAPFVLRRLKRDVLDQLSDKVSVLEKLSMTDFQRQVYDSVLLGHTVRKDRLKAQFEAKDLLDGSVSSKVKKVTSSSTLGDEPAAAVKPKKLTAAQKELVDLTSPAKEKAAPARGGSKDVEAAESDTVDLAVLEEVSGVVVTEEAASQLVNELSASEANHLFTALRKAANHPLLLRVRYKDPVIMDRIAMVAYHQEHFGNQCNYERVREEVDKFSDYDLHLLCLDYPDSLRGLELSADVLYDSPKMKRLREMLPQLQVSQMCN
jgi:SWI/SNF-related matrix-associated actin-dependent regulator 1 of chromatin subfamily A